MELESLGNSLMNLPLEDRLSLLTSTYSKDVIAFSSSFGQEDQAITAGRQFQESYELMDLTKKKYQFDLITYFPNHIKTENLVREKGFNSFYTSVENRKECCFIRKMEPLARALEGVNIWITGLRAEQSENRAHMPIVEWDEARNLIKVNPIIDWNTEKLNNYLTEHKIPQNPLHKKGFISIGCAPCTRAIGPDEHPRAGRWWWENSQKECGLHA